MFCTRCGHCISVEDRDCKQCHADLTLAGAIRMTNPTTEVSKELSSEQRWNIMETAEDFDRRPPHEPVAAMASGPMPIRDLEDGFGAADPPPRGTSDDQVELGVSKVHAEKFKRYGLVLAAVWLLIVLSSVVWLPRVFNGVPLIEPPATPIATHTEGEGLEPSQTPTSTPALTHPKPGELSSTPTLTSAPPSLGVTHPGRIP